VPNTLQCRFLTQTGSPLREYEAQAMIAMATFAQMFASEKRAPQVPEVPTLIESGFPGYKVMFWTGLMAPAGTPKEIVDRIAIEVVSAMKDPKFVKQLEKFGAEPLGNSPEEFKAMISADIALWGEAVGIAGVKLH
jgi:tripartite-type tricarboxylate transporter receptor subunit TctC